MMSAAAQSKKIANRLCLYLAISVPYAIALYLVALMQNVKLELLYFRAGGHYLDELLAEI
jgi:hypothetical protein